MSSLPANRMDLVRDAHAGYLAMEIRDHQLAFTRHFDTVEQLIAYAQHYAGIVTTSEDLTIPAYDAGLLVVAQ